jgi:hypothetical protein
MKKSIILVLLALSSGFTLSQVAVASPNLVKYHFVCPKPTGNNANNVINDNGKILGYGSEFLMDKRTQENPFFIGYVSGANIPANLSNGNYTNSSTGYDTVKGIVSCFFSSGNGHDSFHVDYKIKNGNGGNETSHSATSIQKFTG